MNNISAIRLYVGEVWHKRWQPVTHYFRYRVFYLLVDVDCLSTPETSRHLPWCLSLDRFNLFSLYRRDYLNRCRDDLKGQITAALHQAGIVQIPHRVLLLTMPRVLGYAFNPINVFYCLDVDDAVMAVLYEVNNTFGETHHYVFLQGAAADQGIEVHGVKKAFHVSPFLPVDGAYAFQPTLPLDDLSLLITYQDPAGMPQLAAGLSGQDAPLTAPRLMKLFVGLPLLTLKVTAAIHWQALRLWLKGLRVWRKPEPPTAASTPAHRNYSPAE